MKKQIYDNVSEIIGNTPIVRLNRVAQDVEANFFAKLEFLNPTGSVKDRIAKWMIEDAEEKGLLKPGMLIFDKTSGNTGISMAMVAAIKGYKCRFVLPDKTSTEKLAALKAYGVEIILAPVSVSPDDPRSFFQVTKRLARETPNSYFIDQYDNTSNREAHYKFTGPEILEQMPEIDVLVGGLGTGGTICGAGKYLKEKKPGIKIIAVEPTGSTVSEYFKTGKVTTPFKPYFVEGMGGHREDLYAKNYDLSILDDVLSIDDRASFKMTLDLLKKEGICAGPSSGTIMEGALRWIKSQGSVFHGKNVLTIMADTGDRYTSKTYNKEWLIENGLMDPLPSFDVAKDTERVLKFPTRPKQGLVGNEIKISS